MSLWCRRLIEDAAAQYGLDPNLVEAVVLTESSGQAHAYRHEPGFWTRYLAGKPEWSHQHPARVSSSYGLMQIMYPVAKELGFTFEPEYLFVPNINLEFGCKKLRRELDWAKGDVRMALMAYNGGRGSAIKATPQVQVYAAKVQSKLRDQTGERNGAMASDNIVTRAGRRRTTRQLNTGRETDADT